MSIFVHATAAAAPKTETTYKVAVFAAGLFIVLALTQLFSFTNFATVIDQMGLPGVDEAAAHLLAALVVVAEVFSLPFLLGMRLSPAMRVVSMGFGWLVAAWWLYVLLWQNLTASGQANCGLLGALVSLPSGWWAVCFMLGVAVLIIWTSWGRWPFPLRRK